MKIFPRLIEEKIEYYMWRMKITTINAEYHELFRTSLFDNLLSMRFKIGKDYLPVNNRRISYDWWFQYYRGQSTNLGYNTFIYSFITGKIVGFLNPQKYSWSIRI